ncbi:unnamed protein product [Closterium sp. NIES-64]|nr:unnamed protein product [Closterium sp. NIES-64]
MDSDAEAALLQLLDDAQVPLSDWAAGQTCTPDGEVQPSSEGWTVLNFMGLVGTLSPELSALSALTTITTNPPSSALPSTLASTLSPIPFFLFQPLTTHLYALSLSSTTSDLGMNLFNVELSDFVAPLLRIKSIAYINYLYGSVPEAFLEALQKAIIQPILFRTNPPASPPPPQRPVHSLDSNCLTGVLQSPPSILASLASNYLTGVLPSPPSVALKTLDVSGNFFAGSFPSFASQLDECSAGGNCLSSSGHCSSVEGAGGEQRGEEACAVCGGSMKSTQVNLCGEGKVCVAEMDTVPESAEEAGSVTVTMVCQEVSAAEDEDVEVESGNTNGSEEEEDNQSGDSSSSDENNAGSSGDESAKETPTGASEDGAKSSADSGADSGAKSGADSGSEEKQGDSGGDNTLTGSEDKDGDDGEEGEEEGNVEEVEEENSGEGEEDTTSAAGEKGSASTHPTTLHRIVAASTQWAALF